MSSNGCPSEHCTARHMPQRSQRKGILQKAGLEDDWVNNAWRCSYCGIVYSEEFSREGVFQYKRIRGHFGGNTLIEHGNWVSHS